MANEERIAELVKDIKFYQDDYYNGGQTISDSDFDDLWNELTKLDPKNPILGAIGSDMEDDVEESFDGFAKAKHIIPMGSQQKAASPEEFLTWGKKHIYPEYLVQFKCDGASLELQYEKGILLRGITRGDGNFGDDITDNVRKMKNVVLKLPVPFTGGIRGEVIMEHTVHKNFFSDKANCRNAAVGLMKKKDGTGSEHLKVITYDATPTDGNSYFITEEDKIEWLKEMGFEIVTTVIVESLEEVIDYRAQVMSTRPSLDYDIDGLVVKNNSIDQADLAKHRPDKQIAFKFSLDEAVAPILSVRWSETGASYTPVAQIEPTQLCGTTVRQANLCNPNMITKMDLRIGSLIVITKRGEIIPKIESLVENPEGSTPIEIPTECSTCGSKLVNEGTRLYCPNSTCSKKGIHQIMKWIKTLKIKEFGTALVDSLYREKLITSIYSLYVLKTSDLANLDRMGEKSALKVLKNRDAIKSISLPKFIAGFDIEDIGQTLVEKLEASGFDTLEKILKIRVSEISDLKGFNTITAEKIVKGLSENADQMRKLSKDFITIEQKSLPTDGGKLKGMSFVFTGALNNIKRAEAEDLVKSLGGTITSVNKNLSFLVTNESSSSAKYLKASELGIPVIDEETFLNMTR